LCVLVYRQVVGSSPTRGADYTPKHRCVFLLNGNFYLAPTNEVLLRVIKSILQAGLLLVQF
jgi:hypothetical protein